MRKALILLFLTIAFFVSPKTTLAQTQEIANKSVIIDYYLAYPGILLDHPLYKLKVLRNKIQEALTTDSKQKIEFYLLQADKGILASAILIDKKNISLSQETALKAEHNMTLITAGLRRSHEKPDLKLIEKLKTASLKHQEVLNSIVNRVPKNEKETFINVLNFSKANLSTIERFQAKNYR